MNSIYEDLKKIIIKVCKISDDNLKKDTSLSDIPEWDSINNVRILLEIEKKFKKRIDPNDVLEFKKIRDLVKFIDN